MIYRQCPDRHTNRAMRSRVRLCVAPFGVMSIFVIVLLTCTSAAFAAQPPQVRELHEEILNPTRALIEPLVETYGAEVRWTASYSDHENPGEYGEQWVPEGEGILNQVGTAQISLGAPDETTPQGEERCRILHHLVPNTDYYARFTVEDVASPKQLSARIFAFTTPARRAPELPRACRSGPLVFHQTASTRTSQNSKHRSRLTTAKRNIGSNMQLNPQGLVRGRHLLQTRAVC